MAGAPCSRLRIRRRPSEEVLDAQLADIAGLPIAGGGPRFKEAPPQKYSPETCAALQTLYSSLDDDSNRHASQFYF